MSANNRDRSVSGDIEQDSDGGSVDNNDSASNLAAGKPGRKKNPNSQAARRDQNRIAQREFRLRKQQRIRDLEASVEILSGGKDEALNHLRQIMKDLMQENQVLRSLLRGLSSFIGDGAGGLLPKLGWDQNDFDNFVNRSETDTAWESYQRHKRDDNGGPSSSGPSQSSTSQKRTSEEEPLFLRSKRTRGAGENNGDSNIPLTTNSPVNSNGIYGSSSRSTHDSALFSELLRGSGSSVFGQSPSPVTNPTPQYGSSSNSNVGSTYSYLPPMNINADAALPSMPLVNQTSITVQAPAKVASNSNSRQRTQTSQTVPDESGEEPKRMEAYKLIHYNLENYRRNSAYCLPSSIRPTLVQRSIPHEHVIDGVPHPELRDRMILKRSQFDLVDCLHDYRHAVTIHGDDVLGHQNWEIAESWLKQYHVLVGHETLEICNRWRKERGEPPLLPEDLGINDLNDFSSSNTIG